MSLVSDKKAQILITGTKNKNPADQNVPSGLKEHIMQNGEIIISGPENAEEVFLGSLAEFIIPKLKAQPKDRISQVDLKTNESITVREFLKASIGVAEGLVNLGVGQGDVVVHACSNNIRSHVAAIGVILSGGVFAAIDRNLRPLEVQNLFRQFQPKFIICEGIKAKSFLQWGKTVDLAPRIIVIDDQGSSGEFLTWDDMKLEVDVDNYVPRKVPDPKKDISVISCSSGSTGLPKGVALTHYTLIFNYVMMETLNVTGAHDNLLMTSPLFWISGTLLMLSSCIGGEIRYVPKSMEPEDLMEGIQKCKPFFILLSPALILRVVEHPNFKNYDLSSVKLLVSAGAFLGTRIVEKVKANWKEVPLVQMYGLTEVCGAVTSASGFDDPTTVGKLVPGIKMKVVDLQTGKSLGPNLAGECRLKTKKIMAGYYNNPEDTKNTFDEDGWFRTGDLVYYDENGLIYFVNRIKETIEFHNQQVSRVELESYIIGLPGVKDAAVVGIPHATDGNHVRALVVRDPKSDITAEDIIQGVKDNFSDFKRLRGGVQFVEALPRSEVGKLKRLEVQKMVILE